MLTRSRWSGRFVSFFQARCSDAGPARRFRPRGEQLEERCVPSTTYTVNSLLDANLGVGNAGTLRYVLIQANTNNTGTAASPDVIQFATVGALNVGSTTGVALPAMTDIAVLDGTTAPGYAGFPLITLDGTTAGAAANGLTISGGSSTLKALNIINFHGNGIELNTKGNNTVVSSVIGITASGLAAGNAGEGIWIHGVSSNTIGSNTAIGAPNGLGGNVISANGLNGVRLSDGAQLNTIAGNFIGTNINATQAMGNAHDGVELTDATNNLIGHSDPSSGFQLSNVISGNGADGVSLERGANDNQVAMNYIGTNATGTAALGNGGDGVFIYEGASRNLIGGEATGGNDPTNGVFVRPPQGNLISGNGASGVCIDELATLNQVSGNFIGTAASGNAPLGNKSDGIVIDNAPGNLILGCRVQTDPFVFYNVIGGNGGNGLRITNSNDCVVHANFIGMGADNNTPVANAGDGVLVNGSSANLKFGGVIPLGNVVAGNGRNGVEIADTASGGVYFNTFAGLPAFITKAVPNAVDGFLITSSGGNNTLETNVISGNGSNGVHLSGNATGVQLEDNIIGLVTKGDAPMPNGANGILLDGNTHDNFIGGQQISVIMQNAISANGGDGIAILGNSNHNVINQTFIGTDITGTKAFGNAGQGIFVGGTAHNNVIGDLNAANQNVISANFGQGIQLGGSSTATQIIGNLIGTDRTGHLDLGNGDVGIMVSSSNNQIGGTAAGAGNIIAFHQLGVFIYGLGIGNSVLGNSIFTNSAGNLELSVGGNNEQPAPVLTDAVLGAANTVHITGTLMTTPNTNYTIQVFASPSGTPAEGRTLLATLIAATPDGIATFSFDGILPAGAGTVFTATATNQGNQNTSEFSAPLRATVFAVAPDNGGGPQVNLYDAATGNQLTSFLAYDGGFTGGVRIAVGDVNGDGVPDIVTGPGPGGGPNVRVFDSRTGATIAGPLGNFMAFDPAFSGGVYVAAGDVNGDGFADVIVGADAGGGPDVVVFSGKDGAELYNFFAYNQNFTGGVRVATGDVNGDGAADIVCGAGAGGGPNVTVFSGATGAMFQSFFAFNPAFTAGIYVAAGDTNGDGHADIIAGAGAGGGPNVAVFNGVNDLLLQNFFALPPAFTGGVRVGSFNAGTTGHAAILTGAGPGGGPQVTAFDGLSLALLDNFFAFDPSFTGGIFVGGA